MRCGVSMICGRGTGSLEAKPLPLQRGEVARPGCRVMAAQFAQAAHVVVEALEVRVYDIVRAKGGEDACRPGALAEGKVVR